MNSLILFYKVNNKVLYLEKKIIQNNLTQFSQQPFMMHTVMDTVKAFPDYHFIIKVDQFDPVNHRFQEKESIFSNLARLEVRWGTFKRFRYRLGGPTGFARFIVLEKIERMYKF